MAARTSGSIERAADDRVGAARVDERPHADRLVDLGADAQAPPRRRGRGRRAAPRPTPPGGARPATGPAAPARPPRRPPFRNSSRRENPSALMFFLLGSRVERADQHRFCGRQGPAPVSSRVVTEFMLRRRGSRRDDSPPSARRTGGGDHACRLQAAPRRRDHPGRGRGGPAHLADRRPGHGAAGTGSRGWLAAAGGAGASPGPGNGRGPARGVGAAAGAGTLNRRLRLLHRRSRLRPPRPLLKPPPPAPPEPEPELELTQSQPLALALESLRAVRTGAAPAVGAAIRREATGRQTIRWATAGRGAAPRGGHAPAGASGTEAGRTEAAGPGGGRAAPSPDCRRPREARRARPARRAAVDLAEVARTAFVEPVPETTRDHRPPTADDRPPMAPPPGSTLPSSLSSP